MLISEELYALRSKYLREAISKERIPDEVAEKWIKLDDAFKRGLVKESIEKCEKRFNTDEILAFDKNGKKIA